MQITDDVPLAPFTTLGIGGRARHYVRLHTGEQAQEALEWARARGERVLVLAGGSNLVIADDGFPGLVAHVAIDGLTFYETNGTVTAGAGVTWDHLVGAAVERGWAGVECLSGIPGCVGATPIQNVGAYGQEVAETIVSVDALPVAGGRARRFAAEECGFAYRASRFKKADHGLYVVVGVTYRLRPGGPPRTTYADLVRELETRGQGSPSLAAVREAVLAVRRRKSMVLDPSDPDSRSVGSFFTNPVVDSAAADRAEEALRSRGGRDPADPMPRFPAPPGVKVPAAWLIERCGFSRGDVRGNVGLSNGHVLAIVNRGAARAAEVVALAREIRDRVRAVTGVTLVPEPELVGLSLDDDDDDDDDDDEASPVSRRG
jgi:UDP-N-acetylmuramate dehydrogenase